MKKWKEFIRLLIGGFTIGFGNVSLDFPAVLLL